MKIAIYNNFFGEACAETELSQRIRIAAKNLNWEAIETNSSVEIKSFKPDFVLMLHFRSGKIAGFPTYGCMWNPPVFFEQYKSVMKEELVIENILSYDAYLSSSKIIDLWIKDALFDTNKQTFIAPFYTSSQQTSYEPACIENPRLAYMGTNWDGSRFKELFENLDSHDYMEIYGPSNAWKYLNNSYCGTLPLDGVSVLKTINKAGVGLCLHRQEHCEAEVPSMRIFEIVAAGAVAICEEHPFIREAFGENVLYVNSHLSSKQKSIQIYRHMRWIQDNKQAALEMSRKAHEIFSQKYSLENLLLGIVPYHQELIKKKGFISVESYPNLKYVQIIVRVGGRDISMVKRALDSIANQSYRNLSVIIVSYKKVLGLDLLLKEYKDKISIKVIESNYSGFRSTQLWDGMNAVSSEYFAILDDDDIIHPNHIHSLVSILDNAEDVGVAYSGSIRVWESITKNIDLPSNQLELISETAKLTYFQPFDINKILDFKNFIVSNGFLARTSLIAEIIGEDPLLKVAEDFFIILNFCRKTKLAFSYEATCEYYWRNCKSENSTFKEIQAWEESVKRLKLMFWQKNFPLSKNISIEHNLEINELNPKTQELERELHIAQEIISAMKTSKFWKLRRMWIGLRKILRIYTSKQVVD